MSTSIHQSIHQFSSVRFKTPPTCFCFIESAMLKGLCQRVCFLSASQASHPGTTADIDWHGNLAELLKGRHQRSVVKGIDLGFMMDSFCIHYGFSMYSVWIQYGFIMCQYHKLDTSVSLLVERPSLKLDRCQ